MTKLHKNIDKTVNNTVLSQKIDKKAVFSTVLNGTDNPTYKVNRSIRKEYRQNDKKPFRSIPSFQKFVYKNAKENDNFLLFWQSLGYSFNPSKKSTANKLYPTDKKKKLSIYGNGFAYKNDGGNPIDFLTNYKNYSFDSAYEYLAKIYGIEYEIKPYKPRSTNRKANTTKTDKKPLESTKTDLEKETKAYFEKRIYSELGLNEVESKKYFYPNTTNSNGAKYGIGIEYLNFEGNPFYFDCPLTKEKRKFERFRLTKPFGKQKYHSYKDSGSHIYQTPLFYAIQENKELFEKGILSMVEGEFKAFFLNSIGVPSEGIVGIHQATKPTAYTTKTYTKKDTKEVINKKVGIVESAIFFEETKALLNSQNIHTLHLCFDSDTFDNVGDLNRAKSFKSAIQRVFAACKNEGLNFVFSVVSPLTNCKGIDDLGKKYDSQTIRNAFENTDTHNELFWHFRFDTQKELNEAFRTFSQTLLYSHKEKVSNTIKIACKEYLSDSFLQSDKFLHSIQNNQFTELNALTGGGKSYLINKLATKFSQIAFETIEKGKNVAKEMRKQQSISLFIFPKNALTKQQSKDGIYCTADNMENARKQLKEAFENDLKVDIVYSNYDKAYEAYRMLKSTFNRVLIVVDEAHELVSGSTYRQSVISDVLMILHENQNNLLLTGTPIEFYFETVRFEAVFTDRKPYSKPKLILTKRTLKQTFVLITILDSLVTGKRLIIHYNSIKQVRELQTVLEQNDIKSYVFASDGLTEQEKEFKKSVVSKDTFVWNDSIKVLFTTSCLESGVNIETDCKTIAIYVNQTQNGFDIRSYRQFIARIRNYDKFEVQNIIISENNRNYLPNEFLKPTFNYSYWIEHYENRCNLHNAELEKMRMNNIYFEKDRYKDYPSEGVYLCKYSNKYVLDYPFILAQVQRFETDFGSPYFENPSEIQVFEGAKDKDLEAAKLETKLETEKVQNRMNKMFWNEFDVICQSVRTQTQNIDLAAKIPSTDTQPIALDYTELEYLESLLKDYCHLNKFTPNNQNNELVKHLIVDKNTLLKRKTNDLRKKKTAYKAYLLLILRKQLQLTGNYNHSNCLKIAERILIDEYVRVIKVSTILFEKEKTVTAEKLTNQLNKGREDKYTVRKACEIVNLLMNVETSTERIEGKKTVLYKPFKTGLVKDFNAEHNKLFEDMK